MSIFGVTPSGFERKTLDEIVASIDAQMQLTFGAINTAPDSVMGQLIGVFASVVSDSWQNDEDVYNSLYPSSAEGTNLDNACEMVGIIRLPATASSILASCTGTEGTLIPTGSLIVNPNTGDQFTNLAAGTITQTNALTCTFNVSTVLNSTVYTVVINNSPYQITSGSSASAASIATAIVGNINATTTDSIVATYISAGIFTIASTIPTQGINCQNDNYLTITSRTSLLQFTAVKTGPVLVLGNTINQIMTPINGWQSVNNPNQGTLGTLLETDNQLRIRRALSLRLPGASSVAAIQAKLLNDVTGVSKVLIYENQSNVVDGNNNPPHSFQTVVVGGSDNDIANMIWQVKPAGIMTYGNTTVTITDFSGNPQGVSFSRPVNIYIWIDCTITCINESTFPADGLDNIAKALVNYGTANFNIGEEVFWQEFFAPIYQTINTNIVNASLTFAASLTLGGPPGPYSAANIVMGENEIAVFNIALINMTLTS